MTDRSLSVSIDPNPDRPVKMSFSVFGVGVWYAMSSGNARRLAKILIQHADEADAVARSVQALMKEG